MSIHFNTKNTHCKIICVMCWTYNCQILNSSVPIKDLQAIRDFYTAIVLAS